MMIYPVKTPALLRWLYPYATWHRSRAEKSIFLTFDDGPIPDVTPEILNILKTYGVKATFFCVGENIIRHPELFRRLTAEGHSIGNHTFNHLNGWKTADGRYLSNVQACQDLIHSRLFRPPYGRAKKTQLRQLKNTYQIIMWDVMSGDFDPGLSPEKCLKNVLTHTTNGSVVVFHDNIKAASRVLYALPRAIEHWQTQGYTFGLL